MVEVAVSILAADFAELGREVDRVRAADRLHLDVMDGQFVPRISFGTPVVAAVRDRTNLPLDAHLMVEEPLAHVDRLADAGVDCVTVHAEARPSVERAVEAIHDAGCRAGVALEPETPVEAVESVADTADRLLVMTVEPGRAGRSFRRDRLAAVERLAGRDAEVAVDGGVSPAVAGDCRAAGADVLVASSAVFGSDRPDETIRRLGARVA